MERKDTQVLVIGEALLDVIAGEQTIATPGGSPANVAKGLGNLQRKVSLATCLGKDKIGERIYQHLHSKGVEIASGYRQADYSSIAQVHLDSAGHPSYEFELLWELPSTSAQEKTESEREPVIVHTGSIACTLEPGWKQALEMVKMAKDKALITYDPNVRPVIMGQREEALEKILAFVAEADLVKVSDEDLAWLYPDTDPGEVAKNWLEQGPALVVVTLGAEGFLAVNSSGVSIRVPAFKVEVADTVGAGDSVMSALIDYLIEHDIFGMSGRKALAELDFDSLREMLVHAGTIAAITVSRPGANPPTREELDQVFS